MLTLNLVSQQLKQEIKLRNIYNLLKKVNYIFIVLAIGLTMVLLVARIIMQNNFNRIVAQTTLVTKNNQSYNAKVREINYKLGMISQIQNEFIRWSLLLDALMQATPEEVNLGYLKVNLAEATISIKGRATTRDGLLAFKNNLEKSDLLQKIEFPLKNILEKENIDFEISSSLNIEKLKQ